MPAFMALECPSVTRGCRVPRPGGVQHACVPSLRGCWQLVDAWVWARPRPERGPCSNQVGATRLAGGLSPQSTELKAKACAGHGAAQHVGRERYCTGGGSTGQSCGEQQQCNCKGARMRGCGAAQESAAMAAGFQTDLLHTGRLLANRAEATAAPSRAVLWSGGCCAGQAPCLPPLIAGDQKGGSVVASGTRSRGGCYALACTSYCTEQTPSLCISTVFTDETTNISPSPRHSGLLARKRGRPPPPRHRRDSAPLPRTLGGSSTGVPTPCNALLPGQRPAHQRDQVACGFSLPRRRRAASRCATSWGTLRKFSGGAVPSRPLWAAGERPPLLVPVWAHSTRQLQGQGTADVFSRTGATLATWHPSTAACVGCLRGSLNVGAMRHGPQRRAPPPQATVAALRRCRRPPVAAPPLPQQGAGASARPARCGLPAPHSRPRRTPRPAAVGHRKACAAPC